LVQLLAELEAGLDFADEDIEFISPAELVDRLAVVAEEIRGVAGRMRSRLALSGNLRVALVGPPNAGKSSLFNALVARRGAVEPSRLPGGPAIVSDQRHTTRDYLTTVIDLGGLRCELADTAGLEPRPVVNCGSRFVECGMERADPQSLTALAQAQSVEVRTRADVLVLCVDVTSPDAAEAVRSTHSDRGDSPGVDVVAMTKADLLTGQGGSRDVAAGGVPVVLTSSVTGLGLDELCDTLSSRLGEASADGQASVVAATADRCRDSLRLAEAAVTRAVESAAGRRGDELVAADLRVALAELGRVAGTVYTDDLLDRIFKTFCIGK
jgi:tRNA modification GTPase